MKTDTALGLIFAHDPVGGIMALIVLAGMLLTVGWAVIVVIRDERSIFFDRSKKWLVPVLCLLGLGIAGYLTYLETTNTTAVCGPVGDCNSVQHSPYAHLFGVLPVGLLGMAGYLLILMASGVENYGHLQWRTLAWTGMFGMALFGVVFSIYLTYLEIFVIRAMCIWCLSSAVISTLLLLLATSSSKEPRVAQRRS